jgi:hypothetical protein
MSQTFTYIDTDDIFATFISGLRSEIKSYFLNENLLKVLDGVIRKNNATKPFTFVDYTVHNLVNLLHSKYIKIKKYDLLRFVLLVMLGNDALPQKAEESRYHNTKVLIGEGPLKDELSKEIKSKFPDTEIAYSIIPDRGSWNRTNYAFMVYFGKAASEMRAEIAHKKALKAAKKAAKIEKSVETASESSSVADLEEVKPEESVSTSSESSSVADLEEVKPEESVSTEPVMSEEQIMGQQIMNFVSKTDKEFTSAVLSFVMGIGFKKQAETGIAPNWKNYGELCTMIHNIIADYIVRNPECIPE